MTGKKFFGALDAAEYAATITDEWSMDGDIVGKDQLFAMMEIADDEDELDEEDESRYYFVDQYGAIGLADDEDESVYWVATPVNRS